jgi:hypothetical protein
MTPLTSALTVDADEAASIAVGRLREAGFTYAPVLRESELVGFTSQPALSEAGGGSVDGTTMPLAIGRLVAGDTTLPRLTRALVREPILFVLEDATIAGFVVAADLNKHAARLHWYLLIAGFEIALAERIRAAYIPPALAVEALSPARAKAVRDRFAALVEQDIELDEIASMDLVDLLRAARQAPDLLDALGFGSKAEWDSASGWLPGFRHTIMHPVRALLRTPERVQDLVDKEARLRDLLARV